MVSFGLNRWISKMEKERERATNCRSVGYTNVQWSHKILLIKGIKVSQHKTRLYVDRWSNEEGKHKIKCSLNKDPLILINQQILE
jgi:hypothetical protein